MAKVAKQKASIPAAVSPKLNNGAVKPGAIPKSLSALFVQLNSGQDAIEIEMQVNANMGVANPIVAPIFCLFMVAIKMVGCFKNLPLVSNYRLKF